METSSARKAKLPKTPPFQDGKQKLDSYLQRFECLATNCGWDEREWTNALSALLTGKALDVYSKLFESATVNYDQLKEALLRRYNMTGEGYKSKSLPEPHESQSNIFIS